MSSHKLRYRLACKTAYVLVCAKLVPLTRMSDRPWNILQWQSTYKRLETPMSSALTADVTAMLRYQVRRIQTIIG